MSSARTLAEPPVRPSRRLHCGNHAPEQIRAIVAVELSDHGLSALTERAAIVASELVTNAYRYGRCPALIEYDMECKPDEFRLEVWDRSCSPPLARTFDEAIAAETGFGLVVVTQLTTEWGYDQFTGGKRVWARFSTTTLTEPEQE